MPTKPNYEYDEHGREYADASEDIFDEMMDVDRANGHISDSDWDEILKGRQARDAARKLREDARR